MTPKALLLSLIVGALAGWIGGMILKGKGFGLVGNIIVGVAGALIGGFVFGLLGIVATNLLGQLIFAVLGALAFIYLLQFVKR